LLEKHATDTGLPVIVDYYSDGCGPCWMMALIYKKVAHDYIDRAVLVKVDTNVQQEISARYQIRSLPTFHYFVNGMKVDEAVGGIGEGPLRQQTDKVIRNAELDNVILTTEALIEYYGKYDATKTNDDVRGVQTKCIDMIKKKHRKNTIC
jgi:thioredoxin-like negative regulator of GroEL